MLVCDCVSVRSSWGIAYLSKMMEEVSTMMAYDAHVVDQMSEDEILACLVAETGPTFTVRITVLWIHLIILLLEHCI